MALIDFHYDIYGNIKPRGGSFQIFAVQYE